MTIRSLDMQVVVQKAGEVARIQAAQQQDQQARQQEFIHQIQEQTARNTKTVNAMLRSEQKKVHEKQEKEEQKKKNRMQSRNSNQEKDSEGSGKEFVDKNRGGNLDILA